MYNKYLSLGVYSKVVKDEDRFVTTEIKELSSEEIPNLFIGVYDGHSGKIMANIAKLELAKIFGNIYSKNTNLKTNNVEKLFFDSYNQIEDENYIIEPETVSSGCTASNMLFVDDEGVQKLFIANVGDSHVYLFEHSSKENVRSPYHLVSGNHRCDNSKERERIGVPKIVYDCVIGEAEITRSLGDFEFKKWILYEPSFCEIILHKSYSHLIIASDGLWDVLPIRKVAKFMHSMDDPEKIAKKLGEEIDNAIKRDPNLPVDDVSIIVVKFLNILENVVEKKPITVKDLIINRPDDWKSSMRKKLKFRLRCLKIALKEGNFRDVHQEFYFRYHIFVIYRALGMKEVALKEFSEKIVNKYRELKVEEDLFHCALYLRGTIHMEEFSYDLAVKDFEECLKFAKSGLFQGNKPVDFTEKTIIQLETARNVKKNHDRMVQYIVELEEENDILKGEIHKILKYINKKKKELPQ